MGKENEMNLGAAENVRYEKLPKRALQCMYAADIVTGIIVLAVIGAVNYFWLFPQQIDAGIRSGKSRRDDRRRRRDDLLPGGGAGRTDRRESAKKDQ